MIELQHLTKTFHGADGAVEALRDVTLTIPDGDIFGIIGMSGAGKSTLVRCINLLERPTEGAVVIDGENVCEMSEARLRELRRSVTMIFQHFNLLSQRTCLANVCFPLELTHTPKDKAEARALELLDIVGLKDKANAYPAQLSGGQQQRVAIARALINMPDILFADEPTGNLDRDNADEVLKLLLKSREEMGQTLIMVTHDLSIADHADRIFKMDNGVLSLYRDLPPGGRKIPQPY